MNAVEYVVVSSVKGLSTVPAYRGNRLDGYVPFPVKVGTRVQNVSKYPFELKRLWADLDGEQVVFMNDCLKRAPKEKKSQD